MPERPPVSGENRLVAESGDIHASPEGALRSFRYVVASVNDSALVVWAELFKELQGCVATNGVATPASEPKELQGYTATNGMVASAKEQGFAPSCGWAEFLEKLWLLRHYLDYIHHFCKE